MNDVSFPWFLCSHCYRGVREEYKGSKVCDRCLSRGHTHGSMSCERCRQREINRRNRCPKPCPLLYPINEVERDEYKRCSKAGEVWNE